MKLLQKQNTVYSKSFILLSILFLIINLIQAIFTELANDEAYYRMYSRHLDWGYFDHPPFVALMIKAGYYIFQNEIGVRIFTVLFGFASLYILWLLLDEKDRNKPYSVFVFFMLWFGLPVFNIYTFITVPDSPLLFFALLYILFLRKFKENSNLKYSLILGLIMSLMLYSKYHGVILIIITIIADFKLLKNKYFYLASIFGALLFVPHLLWQYNHDFPSIRYHFYERNSGFSFKFIAEYPLNVLLILNPFYVILFLIKKKNIKKEKTLRFIFWGFIIFFGFSALKSHVEPHWVAVSSIPLLILLFKIAVNDEKSRKLLKIFFIISVIFLFALRIFMMIDILPVKNEFHGNKKFFKAIENKANNLPVIFMSDYAKASKYIFYTNKPAYSRTNVHFRKSQYTLWDFEKSFYNKPVFYISQYSLGFMKNKLEIITRDTAYYYYHIYKNYVPIQKTEVYAKHPVKTEFVLNKNNHIKLKIYNSYNFDIKTDIPEMEISVSPIIFMPDKTKKIFPAKVTMPKVLIAGDTTEVNIDFVIKNIVPGEYEFAYAMKNGKLEPKPADEKFKVRIVGK